jgi:hypothetical protein
MELNIADTFVSHDWSMVSHWALSMDQMKNGFCTFLKTAVILITEYSVIPACWKETMGGLYLSSWCPGDP